MAGQRLPDVPKPRLQRRNHRSESCETSAAYDRRKASELEQRRQCLRMKEGLRELREECGKLHIILEESAAIDRDIDAVRSAIRHTGNKFRSLRSRAGGGACTPSTVLEAASVDGSSTPSGLSTP